MANDSADTPRILSWKESVASARHWETLVFEIAKTFFSVVSLAMGAAGAVLAWSTVPRSTRILVIYFFLGSAVLISACAIVAIFSTKAYLGGFYERRREVEDVVRELKLRKVQTNAAFGSGWTLYTLVACFGVAICVSGLLIYAAYTSPDMTHSPLEHADLSGADLSAVRGLTQKDLDAACGDDKTKLPVNLTITHCR
jgi:hypothetical protein